MIMPPPIYTCDHHELLATLHDSFAIFRYLRVFEVKTGFMPRLGLEEELRTRQIMMSKSC